MINPIIPASKILYFLLDSKDRYYNICVLICIVIRHSPLGMPYGFVRIFLFRGQGFRMITFDRQAGLLHNLNWSQVMVIGRSVLFSDPARPPVGGVGRPKHPRSPPPKRTPGTFLKKFFLVGNKT